MHGALARRADTKIHALVDARGLPITLKLTPGQAHNGRSAADMLATLGNGDVLLADRAYDSDALRADMATRGAWANVRPAPNRKQRLAFSPLLCRYRNLVERFFNKLKHFRTIAIRFEIHGDNYLAVIKFAASRVYKYMTTPLLRLKRFGHLVGLSLIRQYGRRPFSNYRRVTEFCRLLSDLGVHSRFPQYRTHSHRL